MINLTFKLDDREEVDGTILVKPSYIEVAISGGNPFIYTFSSVQLEELQNFLNDPAISFWKFTFMSSGIFFPDTLSIFSLQRQTGSITLHLSLDINKGVYLAVELPTELINQLISFSGLNVDTSS